MAWPTSTDLKRRLDITSSDWDADMARITASGVAWVKAKVGDWDEDLDAPTDAQAQAALERAVELATNGEQAPPLKSIANLYGSRRRFGIG